MYNMSTFPFILTFNDVTPPFVMPESAPFLFFPPDDLEIGFDYDRDKPIDIVEYVLPEATDFNMDEYIYEMDSSELGLWAHAITYDGTSMLTIDCNLLTQDDVDFLYEEEEIIFTFFVQDVKGYKSEKYE